MTTLEMELALVSHFNCRQNVIVPNVSWGMLLHECDLLVLTSSRYAYEIEIKVSKQDLKRDVKKRHKHTNSKIKKLFFAIPEKLSKYNDLVPENAGIIIVKHITGYSDWNKKDYDYYKCDFSRQPKLEGNYKWTEQERNMLMRLGTMRIWTLKKQIQRLKMLQRGKV